MTQAQVPSLSIRAVGTARADLAALAALRKTLPAWAPEGTAGHFLKHADEQTVVAVAAVDRAIQSHGLSAHERQGWTIIAAPRFIGRLAGTTTLGRYSRGGGPAISPHQIPQHSLHSVSGALSILLASRAPNVGVGGGAAALSDGLLAALTLGSGETAGTWLVFTAFDPEPIIDPEGNCTNDPICHAAALALQTACASFARGRLHLIGDGLAAPPFEPAPLSVPQLCAALDHEQRPASLRWRLPWGATIALEIEANAQRLPLAA